MRRFDGAATVLFSVVLLAVAAAVVVLLVVALNPGPSLEEGRVDKRIYDDPDVWYQPGHTIDGGQTCSGGYNNTPRTCHDNPDINVPGVWHHDPERFLLELSGPHPDDPTKTIKDTITVPEAFWNEVRVGQWIDVDSLEIVPR